MKTKKILIIGVLIAIILFSFTCSVTATINTDYYKPADLTASDYETPFKFAGTILNAILIVGVAISVVSIIILGIKYMAGSVEERAEYKKTMMPMLIGMIMLFATTTIVGIIYNLVSNNFN